MLIVSLCDRTGIIAEPWADAGFDVLQVDIQHGDDVRLLEIPEDVCGVFAQPPCTHLAGSGARWWESKGEAALLEALELVSACCRVIVATRPAFWMLENPVGRLTRWLGPWAMAFHPHEYAGWLDGDDAQAERYTKLTCLWGQFTPPERRDLGPHEDPAIADQIHRASPGPDRGDRRSVTPRGFALAFYEANRPAVAPSLFGGTP